MEGLLCARYCSEHWECTDEQIKDRAFMEVHPSGGKQNQEINSTSGSGRYSGEKANVGGQGSKELQGRHNCCFKQGDRALVRR